MDQKERKKERKRKRRRKIEKKVPRHEIGKEQGMIRDSEPFMKDLG